MSRLKISSIGVPILIIAILLLKPPSTRARINDMIRKNDEVGLSRFVEYNFKKSDKHKLVMKAIDGLVQSRNYNQLFELMFYSNDSTLISTLAFYQIDGADMLLQRYFDYWLADKTTLYSSYKKILPFLIDDEIIITDITKNIQAVHSIKEKSRRFTTESEQIDEELAEVKKEIKSLNDELEIFKGTQYIYGQIVQQLGTGQYEIGFSQTSRAYLITTATNFNSRGTFRLRVTKAGSDIDMKIKGGFTQKWPIYIEVSDTDYDSMEEMKQELPVHEQRRDEIQARLSQVSKAQEQINKDYKPARLALLKQVEVMIQYLTSQS